MRARTLNYRKFHLLAALLFFILGGINSLYAQVDPFYQARIENGEKAFYEGKYQEAIEELQVAVFGISRQKKICAKCYIYLSLCYNQLKDTDKSKEYLQKAAVDLDDRGFYGLELDASLITPLENLWKSYFPSEIPFPGLPAPSPLPAESNDGHESGNNSLNPHSYYLQGKLEFQLKNYIEAARQFIKYMDRIDPNSSETSLVNEALAYLILSLNYQEDAVSALQFARAEIDTLTDELIDSLPLDEINRFSLKEIMKKARR